MIERIAPALWTALMSVCFSGCGSLPEPGATGFLSNPELLQKQAGSPFKRSWKKPGTDLGGYNAVQIARVSTAHVVSRRTRSVAKERQWRQDVERLAVYARTAFENAVRADQSGKLRLVDRGRTTNADRVLDCEIALVEYRPTRPLVNAAGYTLGVTGRAAQQLVVSGSGMVVRGSGARGATGIELQLRDAQTGECVFMMADREPGTASIANVKDFGRTLHSREQLRIWAKQIVLMLTSAEGTRIRDPFFFNLKPW